MRSRHLFLIRLIVIIALTSMISFTPPATYGSSPDGHLRLAVVGDLFLGGASQCYALKDPNYIFADVKGILGSSDLVIGNLEAPLSLRGTVWLKKTWTLHSDPRSINSLKAGNISVVTMANNHMMDFGPLALEETLNILDKHGIAHTGAGLNINEARRPAIISANGIKIAVLAYNNTFPLEFRATTKRAGTAYGDPSWIREDIQKARQMANIVVVAFHWSEELRTTPKDYQKYFAHLSIDSGANIVIGHHPHVLQGFECYNNGLIAYSLGNFAFGTLSTKVRDSVILQIELDETGSYRAKLFPVNINNHEVLFQPRLYHGRDADRVLTDLQHYSADLGTAITIEPNGTGSIKIRS